MAGAAVLALLKTTESMSTYHFSADRQLFFYVNVAGQQRLVRFGERNTFGSSVYTTKLRETAEAIRRHSLYKRGVIREQVSDEAPKIKAATPVLEAPAKNERSEAKTEGADAKTKKEMAKEVMEARNFTQAKSLLAKRLDIPYNTIKTPDQLQQLAKEAGIEIVYNK